MDEVNKIGPKERLFKLFWRNTDKISYAVKSCIIENWNRKLPHPNYMIRYSFQRSEITTHDLQTEPVDINDRCQLSQLTTSTSLALHLAPVCKFTSSCFNYLLSASIFYKQQDRFSFFNLHIFQMYSKKDVLHR